MAQLHRSDCSGACLSSQVYYRQFKALTPEPEYSCVSGLCYDDTVKRSAVQQGVKQGRLLIQHVLPAVWKPIHSLWNEVIGFLFLSLATIFAFYGVRYFRAHDSGRLSLAIFCTLLMVWFGVSSFLRARKISRS
jgi:hypothetical protein